MLTVIAEKDNISKNEILINDKSDCNHIQNVFRLKVGDELRVVDGEREYLTKILDISKKEVLLEILEDKEDEYSLGVEIDIALGILG